MCWDAAAHPAWWHETLAVCATTPHVGTAPIAEPAVPWLAVALLPAAAACSPAQLAMLGDAERCVAWALLDDGDR